MLISLMLREMSHKTLSGSLKHRESTKPDSHKTANIGHLFFSSDGLVVNLV